MINPDVFREDVGLNTIANTSDIDTYTSIGNEIQNRVSIIGTINVIGIIVISLFIILGIIYILKSKKETLIKTIIGIMMIIIPIIILMLINIIML